MAEPERPVVADLRLRDWMPRSQLRARETVVARPLVSAIDVHNHLGRWLSPGGEWMAPDVASLLRTMDECGVEAIVNLDGMHGDELEENLDRYDRAHPGRFVTFCQLDWGLLAADDGTARLVSQLEDAAAAGARGVKVWKSLGLVVRDASGALVRPDDPRVVDVLGRAGELGLPVLIHTADPVAFFEPLDAHNERLDELGEHPDWWFGDRAVHPPYDVLMAALRSLLLACPGTTFIGAHVAGAAEDLDRVESLLAEAPNLVVDIGARVAELGRQPRRSKALIDRFPDRILFGTDAYPATVEQFRMHYRFLETADEGFSYAPGATIPPQGRWTVSGLALDPAQLEAVYAGNARRVLGL